MRVFLRRLAEMHPDGDEPRTKPLAPDQFGLSCARVKGGALDERLNTARQVHDKID